MSYRFIVFAFLTCLMLLTVFRIYTGQPKNWKEGEQINFEAIVANIPTVKHAQQVVKVKQLQKNSQELTVYVRIYPEYQMGDKVVIKGTVGAHNIIKKPVIEKKNSQQNVIVKKISEIREYCKTTIQNNIPEPHASLVLGMLLGLPSANTEELTEQLKRTGTIHMMVVSGFNVTCVTNTVLLLAGKLKRKIVLLLTILVVCVFIVLTGAQPPVLRAGIMSILSLIAQFFGRPVHAMWTLAFSATVLMLATPEIAYSISFQLSVLATFGVIVPGLLFAREGHKYKKKFIERVFQWVKGELVTTCCAQIAVMPIILKSFGGVSLIAPLINCLVSWIIPYIMLGGVAVLLLGSLNRLLAQIGANIIVLFTSLFLQVVQMGSSIQWGYVATAQISLVTCIGSYLFLVFCIVYYAHNKRYSIVKE